MASIRHCSCTALRIGQVSLDKTINYLWFVGMGVCNKIDCLNHIFGHTKNVKIVSLADHWLNGSDLAQLTITHYASYWSSNIRTCNDVKFEQMYSVNELSFEMASEVAAVKLMGKNIILSIPVEILNNNDIAHFKNCLNCHYNKLGLVWIPLQ